MKEKLKQLSQRAIALIKDPTVNDPTAMAKLGPIPAKIQHMEVQFQELESEALRVEELIQSFSHRPQCTNGPTHAEPIPEPDFAYGGRRASQTKLRIDIDGTLLGSPGTRQVVSDHKASDSLARCLTLLYEARGIAILETLSKLRVNRGPFVSNRPAADYRNSSKEREHYQFQAIGNSGYHVLTTNTTQEKAENLDKASRVLGFTPGAIKVEVVGK